ncbi:MAG TPA: hypothetical protein VEH29_06790 [Acidimicrobiales bacterium]|nr:hypothetical protein [Acidimicrobiales bacterium]
MDLEHLGAGASVVVVVVLEVVGGAGTATQGITPSAGAVELVLAGTELVVQAVSSVTIAPNDARRAFVRFMHP